MSQQSMNIEQSGKPLSEARAGMLLIHGRGASAASILTLAEEFDQTEFAYLAPQAQGNTWYPHRFTVPRQANEPALSAALSIIDQALTMLIEGGIPAEKIILLGFSQGACLALDYAAIHTRRYGGVVALSGGLIGERLDPTLYQDSLSKTSIFIACSDQDPHIPLERVQASSALLSQLGADVTQRIYPNMGHTVNMDEIQHIKAMMQTLS